MGRSLNLVQAFAALTRETLNYASAMAARSAKSAADPMYPERERWRLRLISIGLDSDRAALVEGHWFTTYRTLGGPEIPDDYQAFACPLFEKFWRSSR